MAEKAETCARPNRRALVRDRPLRRAAYRLLARRREPLGRPYETCGVALSPDPLFGFIDFAFLCGYLCLKHLDWAKIVQRVRFGGSRRERALLLYVISPKPRPREGQ